MDQEFFGPKLKYDHYLCKDNQLHEMMDNGYEGVMGICSTPPKDCLDFCLGQYERFKIPVHEGIMDAIELGVLDSLAVFDYVDPYALFCGISDVIMTNDWSNYAYEVRDNGRYYEVSPENVETFIYSPGTSEESFHHMMSHPGLQAIPQNLGMAITDMLDGEWRDQEDCSVAVNSDCRKALEDLCRGPDGVPNYTAVRAYFELAAWGAAAWIIGPPSRDFRMFQHDIFHVVMEHREAILVDGAVIPPTHYRKLSRPPQSCYRCEIAAWCVELTMETGNSRYICESCLSEGMPLGLQSPAGPTCGTKHCLLAQCPHHPYHYMGTAGIGRTMREYGQLGAVARGEAVTRIANKKEILLG